MSNKQFLRILIAPLDWGLGHTTRCIPIIKFLLECNCTVVIAAEGHSFHLLQAEFPHLQFLELTGYRVRYSIDKRFLSIKILYQLPKILNTIIREHRWLKKTIIKHSIDAVISDNRYGLWTKRVPTAFITHQLQIKGPNKWIERVLRKVNYQQINKFQNCWVPDYSNSPNLAGKLSHPVKLPSIPVEYIGALSRFNLNARSTIIYDVMILVSGPEPQRTIFEKLLTRQLVNFTGKALLVRGLPANKENPESFDHLTVVNHLPAIEMAAAIQASKFVISRAGYTTIMDLVKLGKKCILVPTPGQTEQEYLAFHLQDQGIFLAAKQQHFNLEDCLRTAKDFRYQLPQYNMEVYKEVIERWLQQLRLGTR